MNSVFRVMVVETPMETNEVQTPVERSLLIKSGSSVGYK